MNGLSDSSLEDDISALRRFLAQETPDETADQDLATLIRQLEQAEGIGRDVEGKVDLLLENLDKILEALERQPGNSSSESEPLESRRTGDDGT